MTNPIAQTDKPNEAPDDPHRLARLFIEQQFMSPDGDSNLRFWRDDWWFWDGAAYRVVPAGELKADLSATIKREFDRLNLEELKQPRDAGKAPPLARKVTAALLNNTTCALTSLLILNSTYTQPTWLVEDEPFPAAEVFATKTALLHIPSLVAGTPSTLPPTPRFFSAGVVDFGFDPNAECPRWQEFLLSLWPDDPQSIECLQEWFGYLLLPDTRQHKLLVMIGPPRSGKGTIARMLKSLIGERSYCGPTLANLQGPFGLWPLLGKTLALIPEARLGRNADAVTIVERLCSISGEDSQDVHRKNLPTLCGIKLPVRFVLTTNELPALQDSSGALVNRVVMLRMTRSWVGKEDKGLDGQLQTELSGILNWSIEGWQRLQDRGKFQQPETATELLSELADLASPISQFIRERCIVGPEFSVPIEDLFAEWKKWSAEHGQQAARPQTFGKELLAKLPSLSRKQPRSGAARIRVYIGIGLRTDAGTQRNAIPSIAREGQPAVAGVVI